MENALSFTYWREIAFRIGNEVVYQVATVFEDREKDRKWNPLPRGPGGTGTFSSQLDDKGRFTLLLPLAETLPCDVNISSRSTSKCFSIQPYH